MEKPTAIVVGVGAEQGVGGAVWSRRCASAVGRRRSSAYDASVGHLKYAQPDAFNDKPRCRRCLRLSTPKQLFLFGVRRIEFL